MEISKELIAAASWEESAKSLLGHASQISDFENIIRYTRGYYAHCFAMSLIPSLLLIRKFDYLRAAEDIFAILPSLPDLKDALSVAQSWISRCQPYLEHAICDGDRFGPLLQVDDLKVHIVSQMNL